MNFYALYDDSGSIHCVISDSVEPAEESRGGMLCMEVPADTHPDTAQVVDGALVSKEPPVMPVTVDDERHNAYVALGEEDALGAIWDALTTLDSNGIDVGDKARGMLSKRKAIKQKHPKK